MKKEDLPQEPGALSRLTRELCYVKNEEGKYETALSKGWDIKKEALDSAWDNVNNRVEEARQAVIRGEKSPIYYFMELRLMDLQVLAGYTGFFIFFIKRHMKPAVFKELSDRKLQKYASAFDISPEELKNFKG
jgi:galactokinase/mevalonate kinase-like predicted kinase